MNLKITNMGSNAIQKELLWIFQYNKNITTLYDTIVGINSEPSNYFDYISIADNISIFIEQFSKSLLFLLFSLYFSS